MPAGQRKHVKDVTFRTRPATRGLTSNFQLRQLTKKLEELRKRRKLVELQEDVLEEERLYQAAQELSFHGAMEHILV